MKPQILFYWSSKPDSTEWAPFRCGPAQSGGFQGSFPTMLNGDHSITFLVFSSSKPPPISQEEFSLNNSSSSPHYRMFYTEELVEKCLISEAIHDLLSYKIRLSSKRFKLSSTKRVIYTAFLWLNKSSNGVQIPITESWETVPTWQLSYSYFPNKLINNVFAKKVYILQFSRYCEYIVGGTTSYIYGAVSKCI